MITYALKRRAIQIWGNTSNARKWLRSIEYLGDNWILKKPVLNKNAKTVELVQQPVEQPAMLKRRK